MNKLIMLLIKSPIILAALIFLALTIPINYIFLRDHPQNPLEKLDELVIKYLTGMDVNLDDGQETFDEIIDHLEGEDK